MTVRENYLENPSYCKHCGEKLSYKKRKNKFCNISCSASFNNKGVRRHGQEFKPKYCLTCGKIIIDRNHIDRKYCSNKCQIDWQYYQYIFRWLTGEENGQAGYGQISGYVKRLIVELGYNKCSICGISEWNNKHITLEIDHIDGNCENTVISNLRTICPNCHSQTETYKGANVGNGRHTRRQRYKEEKSY